MAAAVAVAVIGLISLGAFSLGEVSRVPQLGLRASGLGEDLVLEWVQPAGLAWDAGVRPGGIIIAVDGVPVTPDTDATTVEQAEQVEVRSLAGLSMVASTRPSMQHVQTEQALFLALAGAFAVVGVTVFLLRRTSGPPASWHLP